MMTYELDEVEKQALMGKVVEQARADLNDGRPLTEMRHRHSYRAVEGQSAPQCECGAVRDYDDATRDRLLAGVKDVGRVVSVATVRAAIYDVIDGGCTCESGEKHPWELDDDPDDLEVTEEIVNAQRERFVDAVAARITELQAAPHLYDEKLLTRLNDAKAEYTRGYSNGWEDRVLDDEEMRRKVEEGVR